jgi:CHAT domain-containing protein
LECIRYTHGDSIHFATILISPNKELELVSQVYANDAESRLVNVYRNSIKYEIADKKTYSALWQKIDARLDAPTKVLFSPDGMYHQVNINTLMKEAGTYIIDDYQVTNVGNLKDLVVERNDNYSKVAVLMGRPQYDYEMSLTDLPKEGIYRSNMLMEFDGFRDQEFSDLPGTAHEITSISATLNDFDWSVVNKTGSEATEQYVKSISNPGILHIATHGFFLSTDAAVNPMMKSGLVMAGVNNTDVDHEDGILTAYEVTNLNLDKTWLVVLSACETGLGELKNGEGVFGLQRALTVAGASNVMMTLWKVDDAATMQLMSNFYSQLGKGVELEEAFRNSQLEIRKTYKSPKYWGAFVLVKARN